MSATSGAARSILERLVGFDTTSAKSNLPLIHWIRDYLAGQGVESTLLPNEEGDKACLFASIGPGDVAGVALSGHTDVVPVEGQAWTRDPFTLTERDGRLYGRGACDMKGFVAVALAAVPAFKAARLATPIQLVFTYDEETTFAGAVNAVGRLGVDWPAPRALIVGEPTEMRVVDAHMSISGMRMTITGRAAHSSNPTRGANAILAAGEVIAELGRMRDELVRLGDPTGRFTPPHATLNIGRIEGGAAHNIVAERCWLEFGFRGVPGTDLDALATRIERFAEDEVLPKLRATAPEASVAVERWLTVPSLGPEPGSEAERLAFRLVGSNATHTVAYATEGGVFQSAGLPTVVCGPGSIDQAHAPDEFITLDELARGEAFMARLLEECRA